MNKKIKILFILSLFFTLTSCQKKNEDLDINREFNEKDIAYFTYFDQFDKGKIINNFVFTDINGKIVKTETMNMDNYKDIFYYELDKAQRILYMFGNGGLFKIDFNTYNVSKLSDENINVIETSADSFYYYVNGGFDEDGYFAKVCQWEKECIELNYPVNDLVFKNGKLYVSESLNDDKFITILSNDDVSQTRISSCIYFFAELNNELYGATGEGLINLNNVETIIPYKDEVGNSLVFPPKPYYDSNKQLYLLDQMNRSLYEISFDDEKKEIKCKEIAHFNKGDMIFPTLLDDEVLITNSGNTVKTFNLKTKEIVSEISLDLDLFYHVIKLK